MTKDFTYPEEAKQRAISRRLRSYTVGQEYQDQLLSKIFKALTRNRPRRMAEVKRSGQGQGLDMNDIYGNMERETYRANDIQHNGAA